MAAGGRRKGSAELMSTAETEEDNGPELMGLVSQPKPNLKTDTKVTGIKPRAYTCTEVTTEYSFYITHIIYSNKN